MKHLQDGSRVAAHRRSNGQKPPKSLGDDGVDSNSDVPAQIDPTTGSDSGQVSSGSGNEDRAVTFDDVANFGGGPGTTRAFQMSVGRKDFLWTAKDTVRIRRVRWQGKDNITTDGKYEDVANATYKDVDKKFESEKPYFEVEKNKAVLDLRYFDKPYMNQYLNQTMIILTEWETDAASGYSYSGIFGVVKNSDDQIRWWANHGEDEKALVGGEGYKSEGGIIVDKGLPLPVASTTTSSAPIESTAPPTIKPTQEASSSNNELPTGVIAGIAVGAAAGLILIMTLIFCLYRRHRKRQNKDQAGYDSQQGTTVLFVDKETNRISETPRTQYSEDGNRMPLDDLHMSSVATAKQQQPHDHIRQEQQQHHLRSASDAGANWPLRGPNPVSSKSDPASRSSTATPQGVSSNIVHLVEDGMTDDEIRRLEEEERQIEAAIAARKS